MSDATATPSTQSAQPADELSGFDVKIEEVSGARKRLTITVPADMITEKVEESMGTLSTQTTLPGFRKGRAPKALLERRFGDTLRNETKSQVIADGYSKAIEKHEIKPIGDPIPVEKFDEIKLEIGKPMTFSVEVEVIPEFELPDIEAMEIKKPVIDVIDEHVEIELLRQSTQMGEIQSVQSDFEEGDRLLGPGAATKKGDDEPFFTHENVDIIVPGSEDGGRGHVLGLIVDGLAGMLEGKKVGDTISIDTKGPDSHELEHIRGQPLHIEITIREAQHIVPATVSTVVEQYGLGSEDILREQIKLALETRRDEEQRAVMREQVNAYLSESVDFDLPQRLSDAQASRLIESQRLELMYRGGLSVDEVETKLAEIRAETEEQSRKRLKLSFLLHRLAEKFGVEVTDQEINGRIAAIAAQRGMRPEKLRADLLQSGGIGSVAQQIREHKAADRAIDQATVIELSAEEWNKLAMEHRAAARSGKGKAEKASGEADDKAADKAADKVPGGKKKTTKKSTKKTTTKKKKKKTTTSGGD